ncbi:hypothetical protein [Methylobacterium indicum]|uniref:hypothetical protein n=1 Tax=Methylobacterium indicum TaxID=1775910 RepID=UPI00243573E0|nr:hypothetical protein [Methylobacterium indicum]
MFGDEEDLIARATIGLDDVDASATEEMTGWSAVVHLQQRASRDVLEACLTACADADPLARRVAAIVLGELGPPRSETPAFNEERFAGLMALLVAERAGRTIPASWEQPTRVSAGWTIRGRSRSRSPCGIIPRPPSASE